MKRFAPVFAVALLAAPLCAQPKAKPTAKAKPAAKPTPIAKPAAKRMPAGPPPGYEIAKFKLAVPSYYSGPPRWREPDHTTAPDRRIFKRRGPVYLPKGSTNVALRKPVTSSDDAPIIGDLALVTDGEKGAEEGRWVEIMPGPQWIQIDLQKSFDIHGVLLWHYHGEPRVYRDVIVQLADNAEFTLNVRTVYNNDDDNSSGLGKGTDREFYEYAEGKWIPIKAQTARFVRFYSRGNTSDPQNQYIEAEVWATSAKPRLKPTPFAKTTSSAPPPGYEVTNFVLPPKLYGSWLLGSLPPTTARRHEPRGPVYLPKGSSNVALHKAVTSSDDSPIIGGATQITNGEKGIEEGEWVEFAHGTQWVQIDLQKAFEIHGVLLWHYYYPPGSRVYRDVIVCLADDADFTKNVRTVYNNDWDNSSGLGIGKDREYYEDRQGGWIPVKAQTARFVRFYSRGNTSDSHNQYIEAEVWATPAKPLLKPLLKPTPAAKPTHTGPPPGYEVAKFVLPSNDCSGTWRVGQTTAPDLRTSKRRGPVYLPKGSTNVALHKLVTSSDDAPIVGEPSMVTNGKKGPEEGSWVELGPGTQWVQIDLQKPFDIHGVLLWHYVCLPRVYRDVIVRLADDAAFTKNVRTVFNNDDDNSSGLGKGTDREFYELAEGKWIPVKAQTARFVRLYSRGNTSDPQNQYIEAEVWATPIQAAVKPQVKPKPAGPPPGYEVAKFVLPPPAYRSGPPPPMRQTTAPDRKDSKPRGPVYLPKGSTNVALRKPVTSSDDAPIIGALSQVTDGERDANESSWVELEPGTQWVQIDLQKSFDIHGVLLWHYHGETRVYRDVIVQLADNAEFTLNVRTVFNNDDDNSSGLGKGTDRELYELAEGKWIPIQAQKARYVRFYSRGNSSDPQNHYIEVEVWATPAKPLLKPTATAKPAPASPPPGYEVAKFVLPQPQYMCSGIVVIPRQTTAPELSSLKPRGPVSLPKGAANIALRKLVTSSDDAPIIGELSLVTDGEKQTEYEENQGSGAPLTTWVELAPGTQWIQIDLQKSFDIHGVLLWHYVCKPRVYRDVIVRLADDSAFMKNVRTVYNNDNDNSSGFGKGTDREFYELSEGKWIPIQAQKARYVRIYSRGNTDDPQNQYVEAEVWATPLKTIVKPAVKSAPAKTRGKTTVTFRFPAPQYVGLEWVQIDLQKSFDIHGVLLRHYHGERRVFRDVIVRLADDVEFTKNVRIVYNNDWDNSSGLGIDEDREYYETNAGGWIPIQSQKARFVRLYSRGNTSDSAKHYTEAEVWATPVKITAKSTPKPAPAKTSSKTAAKFLLPKPQYLGAEAMTKIAEAAQRKQTTNMPVDLPAAPKTPPFGYEVAKFKIPFPSYYRVRRPNTQEPFQKRGPVYLPKGAANVAAGKKVTSSDDAPIIGTLSLITNEEKVAEEGQWVELGPGTQWVQIDLQKSFDIHGVLLWHYHGEARIYRDVVVQLSDDVDFMTGVRTVYNNDYDNSSGLGKGSDREYYESRQGGWIPIKAQKARYVRFYSRGNTSDPANQYIEAEVWATLAKATAKTP